MTLHRMEFASERALVDTFVTQLEQGLSPWSPLGVVREFDYISGRTDVLSLCSDQALVAFEAKLWDWRRALHQAWRNSSFANQVYVVLPRKRGAVALRNREQFEALGVGLCLIDADTVEVAIESGTAAPVIPWLTNRAIRVLSTRDHRCHR